MYQYETKMGVASVLLFGWLWESSHHFADDLQHHLKYIYIENRERWTMMEMMEHEDKYMKEEIYI